MPTIKVLKIDETDGWNDEEVLAVARRIFGVYVFDAERRVHCCEWTPSYELHFVESHPDFPADVPDDCRERILSLIREADARNDLVQYIHCRQVDSLSECRDGDLPAGNAGLFSLNGIESQDSDEAIEEAVALTRSTRR